MGASSEEQRNSGPAQNGKLSYIQIPAQDARISGQFYSKVFGWSVRPGSADHTSFEDSTGEVIGAWVTSRTVVSEPGVLPYIYVDGMEQALERIVESGGEVVTPPYDEGGEGTLWVALFKDPAGNVIGLWEMRF